MNIADALSLTTRELADSGVPDPRRDAALLVAFATGRDGTFLIAHPEADLTLNEEKLLSEMIRRRSAREPIQYITGRQEFYGLEFKVSPDVLIPRPETELLVESAIRFLDGKTPPRFCEIGTGSGCISIAVLHELKDAIAVAGDVSNDALAIAHANANKHGVVDRIRFVNSDVFAKIPNEEFDAVLSNPPYVPERDLETLQAEVRDHEPVVALTAGPDGLAVIERIVSDAPSRLGAGGILIMEIGFSQGEKVGRMLSNDVWKKVEFMADLQRIPRILMAVKRN